MVGKIGIEIKVDGSVASVTRQLWRYAKRDEVDELILVTTRSKHREIVGPILGKELYVVHLLTFF